MRLGVVWVVYGGLALFCVEVLFEWTFLLLVVGIVFLTYEYLSIRYWVRAPFYCVSLATIF